MASSVHTELMNLSFVRLTISGVSMCRSPLENVAYEFAFISPVVTSMSSSYLDVAIGEHSNHYTYGLV